MHSSETITLSGEIEASAEPTAEETRMPALQGREIVAQGDALGERGPFAISPVRATQNHRTTCSSRTPHSVSPFQGSSRFATFSQGVAVGYLIPPHWG